MRAKWAGVALATVMACGWGSGASAAPVVIDFTISSSNFDVRGNGPFGITPADFPVSGRAVLEYVAPFPASEVKSLSLTVGGQTLSYNSYNVGNIYSYQNGIRVFDAFSILHKDSYGVLDFVLGLKLTTDFIGTEFFVAEPNGAQRNSIACSQCVSATLVSGELPPVPLPASAPMFGAAILALGAVGYGIKRRSRGANATD